MYRLFNRIIDLFTGFDIGGTLNFVLSMDHWDREQIEEYQKSQFQKLADFASRSEYYRSFKDRDLSEFPIVSKDIFRENKDAFYTNHRKPYAITSTSGSTGSPFSFPVSKEMLLMKRTSHQKMLYWYGITREASELKMGGTEISTLVKFYYLLKNKKYLDVKLFLNNEFDRIHRIYNRFRPTVFYGYPSTIYAFISESARKDFQIFTPRIIVTHAENLHDYIFDKLSDVFPTSKIVNQYWATEANIGVTCPSGNIHLDEDTVICEIVNQDESGVGDLIITNLYSYDFPLIRYHIGDRASISNEACICGRKSRYFKSIEGRRYDEIKLANGKKILLGSYYTLIENYKELEQFQIIYSKVIDELKLLYKSTSGLNGKQEEDIVHFFQNRFDMPIHIIQVDKLQFEESGKIKVHKTIE